MNLNLDHTWLCLSGQKRSLSLSLLDSPMVEARTAETEPVAARGHWAGWRPRELFLIVLVPMLRVGTSLPPLCGDWV
jgi:hypothetical protein